MSKESKASSGHKMGPLNDHSSGQSRPCSRSLLLRGLAAAAASPHLFVLMPVTGGERPLLAVNRQAGVEPAMAAR